MLNGQRLLSIATTTDSSAACSIHCAQCMLYVQPEQRATRTGRAWWTWPRLAQKVWQALAQSRNPWAKSKAKGKVPFFHTHHIQVQTNEKNLASGYAHWAVSSLEEDHVLAEPHQPRRSEPESEPGLHGIMLMAPSGPGRSSYAPPRSRALLQTILRPPLTETTHSPLHSSQTIAESTTAMNCHALRSSAPVNRRHQVPHLVRCSQKNAPNTMLPGLRGAGVMPNTRGLLCRCAIATQKTMPLFRQQGQARIWECPATGTIPVPYVRKYGHERRRTLTGGPITAEPSCPAPIISARTGCQAGRPCWFRVWGLAFFKPLNPNRHKL